MTTTPKTTMEVVTIAGGCFWCLQPVFQELRGVEKVEVGYSGGKLANPSYEAVCTDTTGHAEAVQVTFDPTAIPLAEVLRIFFSVHDPTTRDRQGADVGTQYRSAIFYNSPDQEKTAKQIVAEIEKAEIWGRPIVTELTPLTAFYRGEEYHQDYFRKNPTAGYCRVVIAPKVAKFRKQFSSRLKATAVTPKGT
jgi:peptide-methionine (S)-S-oxide reductase